MRRSVVILFSCALVAAACSSSSESTGTATQSTMPPTTAALLEATTTSTSSTTTTTVPPLLVDTFVQSGRESYLPVDECKIRDITPSTPNGIFNNSSGFPVPDGAVPQEGVVKLWVLPVGTTDFAASLEVVQTLEKSLTQVADFYSEQSYGKAGFGVQIERQDHWVQLPESAAEAGFGKSVYQQDFSSVMQSILTAWKPSGEVQEDDLVIVLLPPVPGVSVAQSTRRFDLKRFNNLLLQNGILVSSTPTESGSWTLHAHELGHAWLRLEDLYHFPNFGPFQDYMGTWDIMSNGGGEPPRFSSWARWRAGWILDDQVNCVSKDVVNEVFIGNLDTDDDEVKTTIIPLTDHSAIVIDVRDEQRWDEPVVLVYVVDTSFESGNGPVRKRGLFPEEEELEVEGVRVTLVGRDSSGAVVKIEPAA